MTLPDPAGAERRLVQTVGGALSVLRADPPGAPAGPPVLLLHGVPETAYMWRDLIAELATDRTVIAPDLPGLGASPPRRSYSLRSLVAQAAGLIAAEAAGPVDVCGHDWGGVIGLGLAALRPDLVRRLVVLNAPYRSIDLLHAFHIPLLAMPVLPEAAFSVAGPALVQRMLGYGWRAPERMDPAVAGHYVAAYTDPGRARAMLGYYRANVRRTFGWQLRGMLPGGRRVAHPARRRMQRQLVVWGAKDPVLPLSIGESVVRDLGPGTVFVTVPGAGHFVLEEAPGVVVPAIVGFLRTG